MPRLRTFYFILLLVLIAGNVSIYRAIFAPPVLTVRVLGVGKGDAILVQSPGGKTVLVDTGSDASILRELGSVLPMWQRSIDAVIITSPARASAGGLPEVTSRYSVRDIIRSGTRGERYSLGDGAHIDILWPPETATAMNAANGALVLRISYGATSFLIQNNLPPRIATWLSSLNTKISPPNVTISSSTPAGVYTSNGEVVTIK